MTRLEHVGLQSSGSEPSLERGRARVWQRVERVPGRNPHGHRVSELGEVGVNVPQARAHLGGAQRLAVRLNRGLLKMAFEGMGPATLATITTKSLPNITRNAQIMTRICDSPSPPTLNLVCNLQVAVGHAGRILGQLQRLKERNDLLLRQACGTGACAILILILMMTDASDIARQQSQVTEG